MSRGSYVFINGQLRRSRPYGAADEPVPPANQDPFFTETPNNTGQAFLVGERPAALTATDPDPGQTLTYSIAAGTLPAGLTLTGNGTFSGAATAAGATSVTIRVTDPPGAFTDRTLSLTVQAVPPAGTPGIYPHDPISLTALKAAAPDKLSGGHAFHVQYTPAIAGDYNVDPGLTESLQYDLQRWLPPGAPEGTTQHQQWGGTNRDRYHPRAARGPGFHVLDFRDEMKQDIAAGIDLWFVDVLTTDPNSQIGKRYRDILLAAEAEGFTICAMPDGFSGIHDPGGVQGAGAQQIVDYLASTFWASSCALKVGGKIILAPYAPECVKSTLSGTVIDAPGGRAYWDSYITKAAAKGIQIDLWMCFQASWSDRADTAPNYIGGTHGARYKVNSSWGGADPTESYRDNNNRRRAPAYSLSQFAKPFMQPIRPQDFRPDQGGMYEAGGFDQWLACWRIAIDGNVPYLQFVTRNDLRESANYGYMVNCGWVWLDLIRYYVQWWKTGVQPPIVRDAIYGTHRVHHSSITSFRSAAQTKFAANKGSTPIRNEVDTLVFATAPAKVEVTVCGQVTFVDVPAGISQVKAPLPAGKTGDVSWRMIRGNTTVPGTQITSPFRVVPNPLVQDYQQRAVSSLRGPQPVPKMSRDPLAA